MKLSIVTTHSPEYAPLAALTEPPKIAYAKAHGLDFVSRLHVNPARYQWERVEFWLEELTNCDYMFFTVCSAAITGQNVPMVYQYADLMITVDGRGLQFGSFIMANNQTMIDFLKRVQAHEGKTESSKDAMQLELSGEPILSNFLSNFPALQGDGAGLDYELMERYAYAFQQAKIKCLVEEQKILNAYPKKFYPLASDDQAWEPGDLVCHMPGKSLEFRLEHFPEILSQTAPL